MNEARPFVKWLGGKKVVAAKIVSHFPPIIGTYYEPMVGGGAVFFELANLGRMQSAVLGDTNFELMAAYYAVKQKPEELVRLLRVLRRNNEKSKAKYDTEKVFFYKVRKVNPTELSFPEQAARLIYLNKMCFNGLYRVNKAGKFNSPYGYPTNPKIVNYDVIMNASLALRKYNTRFFIKSYEEVLASIPPKPGDVIYLDPPYVKKEKSSFVAYTDMGFDSDAHVKLAHNVLELHKKNIYVAVSNLDTPTVRNLYTGCNFVPLQAPRRVNSNGQGRGLVDELLILPKNS